MRNVSPASVVLLCGALVRGHHFDTQAQEIVRYGYPMGALSLFLLSAVLPSLPFDGLAVGPAVVEEPARRLQM